MSDINVQLHFQDGFTGTLTARSVQTGIGHGGFRPYEFLLGALGSCYYSTFLSILDKMRLSYREATLDITGQKREEVPQHLKAGHIVFTLSGVEDEDKARRAADLAAKYCSVYYTLSQVAELSVELKFLP